MSAEKILSRLQGVRKTGRDSWMARCPCHDDRHPSLSIKEKEDGRVLVKCWAGCAGLEVIQAVGLDWIDLAPIVQRDDYEKRGKSYRDAVPWREVISYLREDLEVVQLGAAEIALEITLTLDDLRRLWVAAERIKRMLSRIEA